MDIKFNIKYSEKRSLFMSFKFWRQELNPKIKIKDHKVFCIGFHKTGTTSLFQALTQMGYIMGNQAVGEILGEDIYDNRYDRLMNYCRTADAYQDHPFFFPGFFKKLDKEFPGAKFVLSVRDDENQWFRSLCRFWTNRISSDISRRPTEEDMITAPYRYIGYFCQKVKMLYPNMEFLEDKPYKKTYLDHNADVREYFKDRPNDLLELNVADPDSYQKLADFLGVKVKKNKKFPWKNKT
jgi:hypothetical protein